MSISTSTHHAKSAPTVARSAPATEAASELLRPLWTSSAAVCASCCISRCCPSITRVLAIGFVLVLFASAPAAEADAGGSRQPEWSKAVRTLRVAGATPTTSAAPAATRLIDATLSAGSGTAVLTFTLEGPGAADIQPALTLLKAPPRAVLDLGAVRLAPGLGVKGPPLAPGARGASPIGGAPLVTGLRFGVRAERVTAAMIDLGGPMTITRAEVAVVAAADQARTRAVVTVELGPTGLSAFEAQAADAAPRPPQVGRTANGTNGPRPPAPQRPVVVIDAGHGGTDPGAIGVNGLYEKAIVLEVARRAQALLAASGRFDVIMTRETDAFVSLPRRVAIADASSADVFVSLHADSISDGRAADAISGASVYTLSERASSEAARRLAEKENGSGADPAAPQAEAASSLRDILLDLTRRETETLSAELRAGLVGTLRQVIKVARDPNRSAAFFVLRQTRTPSVLVELGYLTNPRDEALMASSEWQQKVAQALVAGLDTYFNARPPRDKR